MNDREKDPLYRFSPTLTNLPGGVFGAGEPKKPEAPRRPSENDNSVLAFFAGLLLGLIGVVIVACVDKERLGPAIAGAVISGIVLIALIACASSSVNSLESCLMNAQTSAQLEHCYR